MDKTIDKPYRYTVRREFWNSRVEYIFTDEYKSNDTVLGVVKETVYIDTRYEANKRLWEYLQRKQESL